MISPEERGAWSSKIGFILAGAGSAIGLGNIWRFPYVAGENGGAVFVLFYLLFVVGIGLPVMIAELSLGRKTKKNPVGAFKSLVPGTAWKYVGFLGVLTGLIIFSWYSVIAGWVIGYLYKAAAGSFANLSDPNATVNIFTEFVSNPTAVILLTVSFISLTSFVVYRGVSGGIEKASRLLMPVLLVLLLLMVLRSITLPGAMAGLEFYLKPDFSKFNLNMLLAAMGQALFSLSLGMGTMITYGSYLSKRDNIVSSATWVCGFDTGIALVSGLVVLPAVAAMGQQFQAGPGLLFQVLPSIFGEMPGGYFFGVGLFVLVGIAALTSTVSILEVPVAYAVDEKGWTRKKAVLVMSSIAFIIALPSALASGASGFLTSLPGIGMDFFTIISSIFGDITLALGSLFIALFVGWAWKLENISTEIETEGNTFPMKGLYDIIVKVIAPALIAIVFVTTLWNFISTF